MALFAMAYRRKVTLVKVVVFVISLRLLCVLKYPTIIADFQEKGEHLKMPSDQRDALHEIQERNKIGEYDGHEDIEWDHVARENDKKEYDIFVERDTKEEQSSASKLKSHENPSQPRLQNDAQVANELNRTRNKDSKTSRLPEPLKEMPGKAPRADVRRQTNDLPDVRTLPRSAPGELGAAVVIDEKKLSPEERQKYDKGWKDNGFNQYASDMILLHRSLPDNRPQGCRHIEYTYDLPDTSVIIIFHNEAWSVLLRTVHSVIDRSPRHLLKEVILVDDCSDREYLHQQLQDYISNLDKVSLIRSEKREGLIHARNIGSYAATGEVLVFLDSHCEATIGWLEPLLDRIKEDDTHVICPEIAVIDMSNFAYVHSGISSVGGFNWNLIFLWFVPESGTKNTSRVTPIRSPTMAGGLFAISRAFFEKLGRYDPGMLIWGGENLELSFKAWMCGGTLEIHPCSYVGHVFRKHSPYSWSIGVDNVLKRNLVRLAEVWLDDYKKFYYERINFELGDYGNITERKQLRANLNCKSFDWYINNIYPSVFNPGKVTRKGDIRNEGTGKCLDEGPSKALTIYPCHHKKGNQFWMMSVKGEILTRDEECLDVNVALTLYGCHGGVNQLWEHTEDGVIRHKDKNVCLDVSADGSKLVTKACTGSPTQKWAWDKHTPE